MVGPPKTPPQPLPTRGRGLSAAPHMFHFTVSSAKKVAAWHYTMRQLSPSPLWGGVGEGSFLRLA
ncbi:hypothetical protein EFQ99_02775 [Rhizobium vallis]|uniref:Uncharacterized protein n=1 Tax=Rhizobium vallis TaxID=634290 RepID=A0A3S0STY1_9HYPH|nr:hypothetical protein EFQ99_02775 [Rhizobium vallis]